MNYLRSVLLSVIVFMCCFAQAQPIENFLVYGKKNFDYFHKYKTYVVLDRHEESDYSLAIKEAVKKYWKASEYEFITMAEYKNTFSDKSRFFLTKEYVCGEEGIIYLSLFQGGQRGMKDRGKILASARLKYYSQLNDTYLYKIGGTVQYLQWYLKVVEKKKFESFEGFEDYVNRQKSLIKTKTLLIEKDYFTEKVSSRKEIEKYYKNSYRVVMKEDITRVIETQDEEVAYISIIGPKKDIQGKTGYIAVYLPKDGEVLYMYDRKLSAVSPVGITGYDLKKMNK